MEREEIRKVAELNHTLRNSLETIADAHYLVADAEHRKMILETVKNMDEKLRQLFPVRGAGKPLPKRTDSGGGLKLEPAALSDCRSKTT